jgi:NAD(P)-dependent dehydrogenase (short-subunit alcohol dehydrogenase family)
MTAMLPPSETKLGPITGLIHGAGVLHDRLIVDKTVEQFRQVYATKVEGFKNLLSATEADRLAPSGPVFIGQRPHGKHRPVRLCHGQRSPQQDGPGGSPAASRMPGHRHQLGALGRRHGNTGP